MVAVFWVVVFGFLLLPMLCGFVVGFSGVCVRLCWVCCLGFELGFCAVVCELGLGFVVLIYLGWFGSLRCWG